MRLPQWDSKISLPLVTNEDLFPAETFGKAVIDYIKRWYPEVFDAKLTELQKEVSDCNFGINGNAASAQALFAKLVFGSDRDYDKLGVFQVAIEEMELLYLSGKPIPQIDEIERRLIDLLQHLRRKVEQSKQESRKDSARQAIVRTSDDFFKRFKFEADAFGIELHLDRLCREIESIGDDSQNLTKVIVAMDKEIKEVRASGDTAIKGDSWCRWSSLLFALKKNPLLPEVHFDGEGVEPDHLLSPEKPVMTDVAQHAAKNSPPTVALVPSPVTAAAAENGVNSDAKSAASKVPS